jgi:hypothetical protein
LLLSSAFHGGVVRLLFPQGYIYDKPTMMPVKKPGLNCRENAWAGDPVHGFTGGDMRHGTGIDMIPFIHQTNGG